MTNRFFLSTISVAALVGWTTAGLSQSANPPTAPPTQTQQSPPPAGKLGTDLIVNPTTTECEQGWIAGMKWTKAEFDQFCAQMKAAK